MKEDAKRKNRGDMGR